MVFDEKNTTIERTTTKINQSIITYLGFLMGLSPLLPLLLFTVEDCITELMGIAFVVVTFAEVRLTRGAEAVAEPLAGMKNKCFSPLYF